jgi:hypothetical protein
VKTGAAQLQPAFAIPPQRAVNMSVPPDGDACTIINAVSNSASPQGGPTTASVVGAARERETDPPMNNASPPSITISCRFNISFPQEIRVEFSAVR